MLALTLLTPTVLSLLALASPFPGGGSSSSSSSYCNTGSMQCCNQMTNSSDPSVANEEGLLGVAAQGLTVPVGLQCNPIGVLAITGDETCTSNPVCCDSTNEGTLVGLNCVPINANL